MTCKNGEAVEKEEKLFKRIITRMLKEKKKMLEGLFLLSTSL